jgi:hypothetical protein
MKKILLIIVLFFVGFYLLLTNYYSDVQINKYDSIEAVKEQKAMEHGWIPKNLPPSAYDIAETHDIDSNIIVGKFSYKERDEATFLEGLTESNQTYIGKEFLFKIDKELNFVNFRNRV